MAGLGRLAAGRGWGIRILEYDLHFPGHAGAGPWLTRAGRGTILAAGGGWVPRVGPLQAHDHPCDRRLAGPRLAHDRQRSGRREEENDTSSTATSSPNSLRRPVTSENRRVLGVSHRRSPSAARAVRMRARIARARWTARGDVGQPRAAGGEGVRAPRGERAFGPRARRTPTAADRKSPAAGPPSGRYPGAPPPAPRCRGARDRRAAARDACTSTIWPAYITAVRSHTAAASSRSCVMNSMRQAQVTGADPGGSP